MLFNGKKSTPPEIDTSAEPAFIAHIDSPCEYPRATLFRVSGWVASKTEVLAVRVGEKAMALSERNDVLEAHPSYSHAVGFSGLARESDINSESLEITATTATETHTEYSEHGADTMLSLSKGEKLIKLNSLFPGDNPEHLIDQSRAVEVANNSRIKFERLQSILKCPQCNSIGVTIIKSNGSSGFQCANSHVVYMLENTYSYLTSKMRSKHNIKNNVAPASRAQDPLAVALIGKFKDGLVLDCGAGLPFQNYSNVINFEIEKFSNTDVIGVGEDLPFADNCFDAVF